MAKEVEALTVLLAARTAEFERSMASSERRIQKVERQMRGSTAIIERDAARMAQKVSASFDQVGKSFNLSGVAIGGLGLAAITAEAVKYSDAWTRAGNSLRVAGVATSQQQTVMDALFASAQRNAVGIDTLTDLYGKAALSAKTLGASQSDLIGFSDGIAVALKASGTSAQAASGALGQLGQALGAGVVRAEEFNSILEGAPAIARAVAAGLKGVDGDIGKLRARMLSGGLTSKEFFDAFLKGRPVIEEMAAKAIPTVENAITRLNNSLTKYVGENSGAQGATRALINGLNYLAENFGSSADAALKFAGIIAAALVGRSIAGMIASLGTAGGAIKGFIAALRAAQSAGGIASLAAAFGALGSAAGPIGAILGVAAAAGLYFYETSRQASAAADSAAASIAKIGEGARGSAEYVRKLSDELANMSRAQIQARIEANKALIDRQRQEVTSPLVGGGRVARGQSNAAADVNRQISQLARGLDGTDDALAKFRRRSDELAAKYPQFSANISGSQRAAEDLTRSLKDLQVSTDALRPGVGTLAPKIADGRLSAPGRDEIGRQVDLSKVISDASNDASKTDRQKQIDKQTDDLVKAYEATGNKMTEAVRQALREAATKSVDGQIAKEEAAKAYSSSTSGTAFDFIAKKESFRSNAYDDYTIRNGKRVSSGLAIGYGTHTVGGRQVQAGDTITREQADAELQSRIAKIEATLSSSLGAAFDNLGAEQKAALDSLAYNYGTLPKDIAAAVRNGTTDDVAKAIRNRGSDNGGINRDRRNEEAAAFSGNVTPQAQVRDKAVQAGRDSANDGRRRIEDLNAETEALSRQAQAVYERATAEGYFDAQAERSRIIREEKRKLEDQEIELTPDKIASIEAQADAEVAAAERRFEAEKKVQDAKRQTQGLAEAQQFFAEEATSAFTDIISGAATAEQAMKKLLQAFIQAALQATLLGQGPLAGLFGTANPSGGLGGLFGGLFGGGKASGGRVSKGQIYPVGENGREYFAPGENGRVIPEAMMRATKAPRAVGPGAAQKIQIVTKVEASRYFDATVDQRSQRVAAPMSQQAYSQAVQTSSKSFPERERQYQRLGY